jgi:hypothetical protein
MAIIFQQIECICTARIICDACQQPIHDYRNAMAIYEEPPNYENPTLTRVGHAHKDKECQRRVRRTLGQTSRNGMWDELAVHLVRIAVAAGMFPDDFRERFEYLEGRGEVPHPPERQRR